MSIKLQLPRMTDMRPRLTVMGIGGAGCNAINNMIASGLTGVDFIVANTDAQALASSSAEHRVQLGASLTEGLGAGSKPEIGEAAAEEAIDELRSQIVGAHMLFIAAGMGGGTGTGAAAVVARAARELGILTVAIVTKPFQFEGARRQRIAEIGINELRQFVDTLIVIPNQNLFRVANERTTFAEAFVMADQVLYSGVACIVDLIIKEGLINLDFADVRTVLAGMGTAMMGTGEAAGERRAIEAAEEAIANPLLDDVSLRGARGLLLSISGGRDLTLYEVDEAASRVRAEVDPEANIIVGATFDESLGDRVRVSIVASGMMRQSELTREPPHAAPSRQSSIPLPGFAGAMTSAPSAGGGREDVPRESEPREMPAMDFTAGMSQSAQSHHTPAHHAPASPAGPAPASGMPPAQQRSEPRAQNVPTGHGAAGPAPGYQSGARNQQPFSDELEIERRISAALQGPDLEDRPEGMPPLPGRPEHRTDVWQAPGSVMIEESPPLGYQSPPHHMGHGAVPSPGAKPVMVDDQGFTPEMPIEIRRQPRRVPEIEEFPPVAQREYRGRSEVARKEAPQQARKPGLFERLGMTRRSDDSHAGHEQYDDPRGQFRNDSPAQGRQQPRGGTGRPHDSGHQEPHQGPDMPALIRKERR